MADYLSGSLSREGNIESWQRQNDSVLFEVISRTESNRTPSLTLVVTNHNYGRFLSRLRLSISKQRFSFDNLELILVDDASTDDSISDMKLFDFPNQRIIRLLQNSGDHGKPSNLGTFLSKGRYVSFVDSDDALHSEKSLSFALQSMKEKHGASVSDVLIHISYENSSFDWVRKLKKVAPGTYLRKAKHYSAYELMERCYAVGLRIFDRQSIFEVGGWEECLGPHCDYGLMLKMALSHHVFPNPHRCYDYFVHGSNMSIAGKEGHSSETQRKRFLTDLLREHKVTYEALKENCSTLFWQTHDLQKQDIDRNKKMPVTVHMGQLSEKPATGRLNSE